MANLQETAQECVGDSLNLYLDTVAALTENYATCKQKCLDANKQLAKDIADMYEDGVQKQKTKYFDPHANDPCLTECRMQYYFILKRVNRYLVDDKGFYIEKAHNFDIQTIY